MYSSLYPYLELIKFLLLFDVLQTGVCTETAASILVNGVDLFRLDLQGVVSLVPSVLGVLEVVLPEAEVHAPPNLPVPLLRRAATHVLLSILPLPLHFQVLLIIDISALSFLFLPCFQEEEYYFLSFFQ